ncbi:MAG: 1-acyl-sn-glycerol-3-phosphate acyltransferase [Planctomycetes bacterium]|nr:1-acyl-sn-glycerol-3-phosphate acyltransferase [Planctomycetota bacterium]
MQTTARILGGIAALVAAVAATAWIGLRIAVPGRFTTVQRVLMVLATGLVRLRWGARYARRMPCPRGSGAVYIANHRSSIDPFFLQVRSDRPMHWMVAKEFCEHRRFRWFLRQCEVIPTNRGGTDTAATKSAIRFAAEGDYVGMFPEGRINATDDLLLPCRPGAIVVALRARVPVIPCYIEGSPYGGTAGSPIRMRARVRVHFGEPIDLAEYYERCNDADAVREAAIKCLKEIARLAGRDDFEPTLAGRRWLPEGE